MRYRGAARRQAFQFGIGGMNIVRHHWRWPAQAELFVDRQIIGSPRKQARDFRDLLNIFVDVRLKQEA